MVEIGKIDPHQAFLLKYEHQRFYALYPPTVMLIAMSIFGVFGNFNIVWASLRKKTLRSNCNIFIASVAFADIFTQLAHFAVPYHLFFGSTFITFETCFYIQAVSVFFMNFATFTVLIIGVDRLFAITLPVVYKGFNSKAYVLFMWSFPSLFGAVITYAAYTALEKYGKEKTFCFIANAFHDSVKDIWAYGTLATNLAIIIVYSLMGVMVKVKKDKYDKKILRSLIVIMLIVMFGWFGGSLVFGVALQMGYREEELVKIIYYTGSFFINTSISLNYPVYMYFSKEYRNAFMEQLKIMRIKNRVIPSEMSEISSTTGNGKQENTKTNNTTKSTNNQSIGNSSRY